MSSHIAPSGEIDRTGYDPITNTCHSQFNWEDSKCLCVTIAETVSAVNGQEPTTGEVLYSVTNPEKLESLLSNANESDVRVSFAFGGVRSPLPATAG